MHWNTKSSGHIAWDGTEELIARDGRVFRAPRSAKFDENGYRCETYQDIYTRSVDEATAQRNAISVRQTYPEYANFLESGLDADRSVCYDGQGRTSNGQNRDRSESEVA